MKLFVYGTLKKGFRLHYFLNRSKFVGNKELKEFDMYKIDFNGLTFPYVIPGKGTIKGEVYEVSKKVFEKIKRMESEGGLKPVKIDDIYLFVADEKYVRRLKELTVEKIKDGIWKGLIERRIQ